MSSADATERARAAARARWEKAGGPVVSRAVQTVVDRSDELNETQWDAIRSLAGQHEEDGDG